MAGTQGGFTFRRAVAADLPLLTDWLAAPHLREWFGDWVPELDRQDVRSWIVSREGAPLGYIQDYRVGDFDDHPLAALGPEARGIDQFIGPVAQTGQGLGPGFIKAHCARLLAEGAHRVGTDPDPQNARAIRAYEKAGFRRIGPPLQTKWGPALPMGL